MTFFEEWVYFKANKCIYTVIPIVRVSDAIISILGMTACSLQTMTKTMNTSMDTDV